MPMLSALPDAARVWLFVLDGPVADVLPAVRAWLPRWQSHGRPVTAAAEAVAERVLAVGAVISPEEVNAGVSGCGIDAMRHAVEAAVSSAHRGLVPALDVVWVDAEGAWHADPRPAFRQHIARGTVGPATLVVDVTAETVGALRAGGALRPAAEAWTGRVFGLVPPAGTAATHSAVLPAPGRGTVV